MEQGSTLHLEFNLYPLYFLSSVPPCSQYSLATLAMDVNIQTYNSGTPPPVFQTLITGCQLELWDQLTVNVVGGGPCITGSFVNQPDVTTGQSSVVVNLSQDSCPLAPPPVIAGIVVGVFLVAFIPAIGYVLWRKSRSASNLEALRQAGSGINV